MRAFLVATLAVALISCAKAEAQQTAAQPPCSTPEFRQMDFWLGTWDAHYTPDTSQPPGGSNVITREYGGCVIQEQFDGGPQAQGLIGHSVSTYHAPSQQWRQTWVDNQGGYFALVGGPVGDDFILNLVRPTDRSLPHRMVFEDITHERFTWRWQRSTDEGQTWTDLWVIYYVRRAD
jgi:hypothetical protein